jgi:aspartate 1-decarboxylase
MLKGKIQGAVVTDANVEYEGSITIDAALMKVARIIREERGELRAVSVR